MQIVSATANEIVIVSALLLFSAFASNAFAQRDAGATPTIVDAGPFRIHANEEVAARVQSVGEQTWEIASKLYGSPMPEEKMDAHLYRNLDEYVDADQELTGGKFKRNLAFAHHQTFSAHVTLQPPISDSLLKKVGLPKQSARLLAHEMAHLVRFDTMPNTFEDHPEWLIDGVAALVSQRVLVEVGYMKGAMHDPHFGTYVEQGKEMLAAGQLPTAKQLLDNESLDIGFVQKYVVRWLFVDMLVATQEEEFRAYLKHLRRVGGGGRYVTRSKELLLEHLKVDIETLDSRFRDHVKKLQPKWLEHGRSLETMGEVWDQIAYPDSTATGWRRTDLGDSFVISTTATIRDAGGKQLNIRIGQPNSFTQFSVTAGYGLDVFDFADSKWKTRVSQKIDGIKIGQSFKLELSYDEKKKKAVVTLDGEKVYSGPMDRGSKDQFALGAQLGSAISWGELKLQ